MRFNPEKVKPMSEETRQLGKEFVQALLREGHDYNSIQSNFLALLGTGALRVASRKLATNPAAILETSGYVRGSMRDAAKMLGITRNYVSRMVHGAATMAESQ
jgi:hypothetical protein